MYIFSCGEAALLLGMYGIVAAGKPSVHHSLTNYMHIHKGRKGCRYWRFNGIKAWYSIRGLRALSAHLHEPWCWMSTVFSLEWCDLHGCMLIADVIRFL